MKKLLLILPTLLLANIEKIEYKGLLHISPISANNIIKIKIGDEFNIEKIDKSIKSLYNTGYFQTIKAIKKGNSLIFECLEKPTILKIDLKNVSEDLKKALKESPYLPKKGEILSKEKLDKLKEFINSYYLAKGYFNTIVNIEVNPISSTSVKLIVSIKKGEKLVIKDVKFYGATIDKDELIEEIENRPRTFWSILPFTNSGELNIYKLISDKESIQKYYLNLGYMDAKVSTPLAKSNFDNYTTKIHYQIKEGIRYLVKEVKIEYPKELNPKLEEFNLKVGNYFNISALKEDLKNITHSFQNLGYAYVKVYPEIKKEKSFVFITYKVIPGEIVYIKNVIIKGNRKTLDRVIRRDIYLAPGDKFSYQDLIDSKNALNRNGYLEDVKIEQKRVSNNQIDLIVTAKEGLSGSLRAGISYGSYTKFGFNFSLTEKNIFGSGQSISASADFSSVSKTYKISLYNPRIFDSKYSFTTSIFNTKSEGISYTEKKSGFNIGIGKKLSRYISSNITYGYSKTKLSDYDTTSYTKPNSTKSYIEGSISFDNTDNYFFPTEGEKASLSIEYAGIGGDEKYIKALASYKYFYPIKNKTYNTIAVLKYRVIGGAIKNNGYLPINEKFYLGGMGSVRGFGTYSISPVDSNGNKIGGKYKFITGPEISTPISIKNRVWLSGFVDYGIVGENSLNISKSSYGIEINWISPMGPISFIWAWPLKSEKKDDLQKFEFNIGASF